MLSAIQVVSATQAPQSPLATSAADAPKDIVVTGRFSDPPRPAETEFNEDDIAADGSDTIGELLDSLQPFIDPSGTPPLVLINGKPAGFDASIELYPVEALAKVAVLPPDAARRYGASSRTRVVNLVLKRKFSSFELDTGGNLATLGGEYGGNLGLSRDVINGDTRWSVHAQTNFQSELLRSSRTIPGTSYDLSPPVVLDSTNVASALNQYASNHSATPAPDDSGFETLQPSSRNVLMGINLARPIGGLAGSLSLDAGRSSSLGLRGIPEAIFSLTGESIPPDNLPVIIQGSHALRNNDSVKTYSAAFALSGLVRGVQTNFGANFSSSEGRDLIESGPDSARLQQYVNLQGADFDPNARFDGSFNDSEISRTHSRNASLRLNLQKTMGRLPAGFMSWAVSATTSRGQSDFKQYGNSSYVSQHSRYAQSGVQASVNLPISSPGTPFHVLGDLSLDLSLGEQTASGGSAQTSYGSSITWVPIPRIQFRGSIDRSQIAPSPDQLNAPILISEERVFDYQTQQYTQVAWTTGGNPLLPRGRQTSLTLALLVKPLALHDLALNIMFRDFVSANSPMSFPELTPAIEQAFPDRVTRNSAGQLTAIDARAVTFERQDDATLTSNVTLRMGGTRKRSGESPKGRRTDAPLVSLSLEYQLRLWSLSVVRQSLPVINRLASSGISREQLNLRLGISKRAFGSNIGASWRSSAAVTSPTGTYRVTPPLQINVSLFANLDRLSAALRENAWARRTKISFDIENLTRSYRRVRLPNGETPAGYSRDEADPVGRTVRLSLKKQF